MSEWGLVKAISSKQYGYVDRREIGRSSLKNEKTGMRGVRDSRLLGKATPLDSGL